MTWKYVPDNERQMEKSGQLRSFVSSIFKVYEDKYRHFRIFEFQQKLKKKLN